jgi:transcriptional regulator with XRE-family HTH domain
VSAPAIYKRIGLEVAQRRKGLGVTQKDLSGAIGISRAAVANIERGDQRVFFDQIVAICSYLGIKSIDELLSAQATLVHAVPVRGTTARMSGASLSRSQKSEVRQLMRELDRV